MILVLKNARIEKITPHWPARADSKARFQLLMQAVEKLLLEHGPSDITIQMIADEARMPTATVYHFFPSVDAAMFAQARVYIERFEKMSAERTAAHERRSWQGSWRVGAQRGRELFTSNVACMRLLLGPDVPRDIQTYDSDFNVRLGRICAGQFHDYFVTPDIEGLEAICTNAIEISDTFWRMSFERHGTITDAFFDESMRAVVAYLRTYLPEVLTPREA
jgi:AcrR family transcriptional regulator